MHNFFTPGPWEALTFSNHELQTDFAMVKIGSRVHMVGCSGEDNANALLIAAAPELLDALNGLLIRVADDEEYGPDHAITIARAAIAKAIG